MPVVWTGYGVTAYETQQIKRPRSVRALGSVQAVDRRAVAYLGGGRPLGGQQRTIAVFRFAL